MYVFVYALKEKDWETELDLATVLREKHFYLIFFNFYLYFCFEFWPLFWWTCEGDLAHEVS